MNSSTELEDGLRAMGIVLDDVQRHRLLKYLELICKWNRVYNLTAIRETQKLVTHHLLDSLSVMRFVEGSTLIDVGTGPGLPGIPLAIAAPSWRVTLLDSNHKKGTFLRQVKAELGLDNVEVVTERAESYQPSEPSEAAVSRAFSDLATFVQAAGHLVRPDGCLLAMKGVYPNEELEQLPSDMKAEQILRLQVPGMEAERHLVILRRSHGQSPS